MVRRKIQEVGGGTFTVSLPREWAQEEDISQGEEVDILTHIDGTLVVQTRNREMDPTGAITLSVGDRNEDHIRQILWAAYTAGYAEITLAGTEHFSESQRATARDVARTLAGATVVTDEEREISLQVLIDPEEISVRQVVRQLSFVAFSMYQEAVAALDDETASRLDDRDDQADRLYAMTDRSFSLALSRLRKVDRLGLTRPELFELWSAARDLERVADHAERIGALVDGLDSAPKRDHVTELADLAEQAESVVRRAVDCVLNEDRTTEGYRALSLRTQVRERVEELDQELFTESTADYRLARVLDSVRRVAEHGGNIAERGLQGTFRREDAAAREANPRATND